MNSFDNLQPTESKVSGLVYVEGQSMNRNSKFMERFFAGALAPCPLLLSHAGNIFGLLEYEGPVVVFNLNMEMNF